MPLGGHWQVRTDNKPHFSHQYHDTTIGAFNAMQVLLNPLSRSTSQTHIWSLDSTVDFDCLI